MAVYKPNPPEADILMSSMRSMGYTFESAIADVVDNSVSAKASIIEIKFPIDPKDCYVAVCDNGFGMDPNELVEAMKYGSSPSTAERSEGDLGRFGLGLKSASLSQCRKLTVISKKDNCLSGYFWDLDYIEENKDWLIGECSSEEINITKHIDFFDKYESGTIVLWEHFDFIEKSSGSVYSELTKYQNSTTDYLSLIFHRYLNKEGKNKTTIKVNNFKLVGLDPFLESNPKTDNLRGNIPVCVFDSNGIERMITVQAFVLPFQKDITKEDEKKLGGVENYRTKQGFYIYRNERLIIWGTWFGRPKSELTKYARIKVDIPNTLDDIWGIDIKKQNAKIPVSIKHSLTKAVDEAMDKAVKKQTYRGRIEKVDDKIDYIWDRVLERGTHYTYKINRKSKIFDLIKDDIDGAAWNKLEMVLDEIENGIPYQQIYIDKSQNKVYDEILDERVADIKVKAKILIKINNDIGLCAKEEYINNLFLSEPFSKYENLKQELIDEEI